MTDRVPVPEQLRPLAEQLAALSSEEQELVIAAARQSRRLRSIPWTELRKLEGTVELGGNAVEDCRALYDDA